MLFGLLITIGVAVAIVLGVALPHLRQGSRFLSDEGEQRVRNLREKAAGVMPGQSPSGSDQPPPDQLPPDQPGYGQPAYGQPGDGQPEYDRPAAGRPGYDLLPPDPGHPAGHPAAPRAASGSLRERGVQVTGALAGSLTRSMTRAREAFDGSARRFGHAAERYDVAGSAFGASAEQVGERARRGMTGALRWLGTRPERLPAAPDAAATATAPHGVPMVADPWSLPSDAPRTPEVGIPADPAPADGRNGTSTQREAPSFAPVEARAAGGDRDVIDRPIGLTIDLRDLPDLPALRGPAAVRQDGPGAADGPDLDDDDLIDEDDDESARVGPRHMR